MLNILIYLALGLLVVFTLLTIKVAFDGPNSLEDIEGESILFFICATIFWPIFVAVAVGFAAFGALIWCLIYASNKLGKLLKDAIK